MNSPFLFIIYTISVVHVLPDLNVYMTPPVASSESSLVPVRVSIAWEAIGDEDVRNEVRQSGTSGTWLA